MGSIDQDIRDIMGTARLEPIVVQVERELPVVSPAYPFGNADEATLAATWAQTYGVSAGPAEDGV